MIHWHPQPRVKFHVVFSLLIVIFSSLLFINCNRKKTQYQSPPGYDLSKPYRYNLPTVLDEISGLAFYAKDSGIFAIQDEKGFLFKIHLKTPLEIEKWKFSTGADYEDIALIDSSFFVLKSKGVLEKFNFLSKDSIALQSFPLPVEGNNEYETLFYDSSIQRLIIICKNCEDDRKKEITTWTFNPRTDSFSASYVINTEKMREKLNEKDLKFKPSAAAINPLTGEIYVIASVNKALVILNKDYSFKDAYHIDPGLFKQPEGLIFTPKGDLIISNESANTGPADILFFKYHKSNIRK